MAIAPLEWKLKVFWELQSIHAPKLEQQTYVTLCILIGPFLRNEESVGLLTLLKANVRVSNDTSSFTHRKVDHIR